MAYSFCMPMARAEMREGDSASLLQFMSDAEKIEEKSEFETEQDYKRRIVDFIGGKIFTISTPAKVDFYSQYGKVISYDAENRKLSIKLIGQSVISNSKVFDLIKYHEQFPKFDSLSFAAGNYSKFKIFESKLEVTKEYNAQNAFGASFLVSVAQQKQWSVAFAGLHEGPEAKPIEFSLEADPKKAKAISQNAYWRLTFSPVLLPAQRKLILDDGLYSSPTIKNQVELAVEGHTMMAHLISARLVLDDDVIAAFAPVGRKLKFGITYSKIDRAPDENPKQDGGVKIMSVANDSPAQKCGLNPGDVMLEFNGRPVKDMLSLMEAIDVIPPGSLSKQKFQRGAELLECNAQF